MGESDSENSRAFAIVCTRNRLGNLLQILGDLSTQTRVPDTIVIVDSSDTAWMKRDFQELLISTSLNLIYLHTRPGLPYQRNVAINFIRNKVGQSDTVHFIDDDVSLPTDYISNAVLALAKYGDSSAVGAWDSSQKSDLNGLLRKLFVLNGRDALGKILKSGIAIPPSNVKEPLRVEWFPGFGMNFNAEAFSNLCFSGRMRMYGEDVDALVRLSQSTKLYVTPQVSLRHNQAPAGRRNALETEYYSDAFRWHLAKSPNFRVTRLAVVWSTFGLVLGELVRSIVSMDSLHFRRFIGHSKFLWNLPLGNVKMDLVSHDFNDLNPNLVFY